MPKHQARIDDVKS